MNQINLIGRTTAEPKKITPKNGKPFTSFSIAVTENKDETFFFDCIAFEKQSETLQKYVKKGDKIFVTGRASLKKIESTDENGAKIYRQNFKIIVNSFEFCESKKTDKKIEFETDKDIPF